MIGFSQHLRRGAMLDRPHLARAGAVAEAQVIDLGQNLRRGGTLDRPHLARAQALLRRRR